MKSIFNWFLAILFLLTGALIILLEEPPSGVAIAVLGIFILPPLYKLISRRVKVVSPPLLKWGTASVVIALVVVAYVDWDKPELLEEDRSTEGIAKLSSHHIDSAEVNGLEYYFINEGEGDVIFFLHGFPDMASSWDPAITFLSKNYQCIAPFLRGYYPTGIPDNGDYGVKSIAEDIVKLADKVNAQKFYLVGQDWGASISYAVANLAPERVKKIITVAIPHPSSMELTVGVLFAARHFFLFNHKAWAVHYTRRKNFDYIDRLYQRWSPDYRDYAVASGNIKRTFRYPGRLQAALGYYWSAHATASNEELNSFYLRFPEAPVLFCDGEHNGISSRGTLSEMEHNMPAGSHNVIFKNAGHFLHREVPEEFVAEVRKFLDADNR